jgi:hypothetical protein
METMKDDFEDIGAGKRLSENLGQVNMNEAIWASTGLIDLPTDSGASPPPYTPAPMHTLSGVPGKKDEMSFSRKILRSLHFGKIDDRANRIKPAFPNTFQWLFGNDGEGDTGKPELTFRRWLGSQENTIFWITGKPASGKSTLMKFIATHESLEGRLQEWAGDSQLYIAKFYFWNPGSKIQKSRVGLLRSLLHQILTKRPELSETIMRRRRLFFDIAGENAEAPNWEWSELREGFFRLASHLRDTGSRFALFIDGLDEYEDFVEENPKTHQTTDEMVTFLMDLHSKYGAKLCVSSRPLNYFHDKFHQCLSLTMQQLTQPDIDHYVEIRLRESPAIQALSDLEPDNITELISDLKTKAQGVFLWVALVVEQLLLTSADTPRMDAIRKVFNDLPDDLHKLYDTIQKQIGPEKEHIASKLYQLIMEWKRIWSGQMEATFLWLADEQDVTQQGEYPGQEKEPHIAKLTKRLLAGHTRGILQISDPAPNGGPSTIDFLHKTTYEWLQEKDNWERILEKGPTNYQPILPILAVLVSHALSLGYSNKYSVLKECISRIFMLAGEVPDTAEARAKLVSIIDRLDLNHLRALGTDSIFFRTGVPTVNRTVELTVMTWAAAWACHPYIRGKLEADPSHVLRPADHRFSLFPRKSQPTQISLLQTAIFGFRHYSSARSSKDERWFIDVRKLNVWQASQRLDTVKLLLDRGAKIEGYMKEELKALRKDVPKNGTEYAYANLLLEIAGHGDFLSSFDRRKHKIFPEGMVWEAHDEWQFPEYKIRM